MSKKLVFSLLLLCLLMFCCACGEASVDPLTVADETTYFNEEDLPPLSERKPGEGRPLRDYCLVEGGTVEEMPEFSVDILGKTFTDKDAANLKLYTAVIEMETSVELHELEWIGYRLKDVLEYLGETLDQPFSLAASDGYSISQDLEQFDDNVMIAISRNGDTDDAPYYAPCSSWFAGGFVSNLSEIWEREE